MKTFIFILKTYLIILIYLLIYSLIYSIYIQKTNADCNLIIPLIFSSIGYMLLTFIWCNHIHKKGLLFGLLISLIHLVITYLICFLSTNKLDTSFLKTAILLLMGGIGGIIGTNVKKIF